MRQYKKHLQDVNVSLELREGGGTPLHMGYRGMCSPKGYGSSAFLVINSYRFKPVCRHFGNK